MIDSLQVQSPKRAKQSPAGWEGFFPYYAGFPETFAQTLLASARLRKDAVIFDPWNGSGTTTYAASQLGLAAQGLDLNPVMVLVARARLLAPSEADSLEPLACDLVKRATASDFKLEDSDPLRLWFAEPTASLLRRIERAICASLVGSRTITPSGVQIGRMSAFSAVFYVALFAVVRKLVAPYKSSNPTWLKLPKDGETKIQISREKIVNAFVAALIGMADILSRQRDLFQNPIGHVKIRQRDTTTVKLPPASVDFMLTSPPYCTRIDYTAATRIELAVISPLMTEQPDQLSRRMIGSIKVPENSIKLNDRWGACCGRFLKALQVHKSKASAGYYYKTHLDYFKKLHTSMKNISSALKPGAPAILVVQDSYYKDIHNDLPAIVEEMASECKMDLKRRCDFQLGRSMVGINPRARAYNPSGGGVEAVLCFQKQ